MIRVQSHHDGAGGGARTGRGRLLLRFVSLLLMFIGAMMITLGLLQSAPQEVQRVSSASVSEGVMRISQGVFEMLGQLGRPDGASQHGLRRYDPSLGAWVGVDQGLGPGAVLLVHGLDEPGGIWDQLAPALAGAGHTVLRFDYANDQAIVRSADELGLAINQLGHAGVQEIDMVCHSMGGLVAREVMTRAGFASGGVGVKTLITLGTPHAGSAWARLRSIAEAREQVQRWAASDDLDPKRLLGFIADGAGQAGSDLLPGSAFLRSLNEREMPSGVRVICVAGRTDQPSTLVGTLGSAAALAALRSMLGPEESQTILDEVDRLGRELGDGVVPVSSAVMAGADEIIVVPANHRSMIRTIELEEAVRSRGGLSKSVEPPAIAVVVDRLRHE